MANAVAHATVPNQIYTEVSGKYFVARGSITIDANPATYVTGGITLSFNDPLIKASRPPLGCSVVGSSGYIYVYVPGTDNTNGKLKIFVQDSVAGNPLAEMANALAIPAGVSGDTIGFVATFNGQL